MIVSDFQYLDALVLRRKLHAPANTVFFLARDYSVQFRLDGQPIVYCVPQGTWTDFASVPRLVPSLMAQALDAIEAAVVHDHMCQIKPTWGSGVAADVFEQAMEVSGVPLIRRKLMANAVRMFGPRW